MRDLSYFNLGFKSDYVSNALIAAKSDMVPGHELLKDAVSIIQECLKIESETVSIHYFSPNTKNNVSLLAPLLWEMYPTSDPESIVSSLKNVLAVISELYVLSIGNSNKKLTDIKIDNAVDFFSNLADICLSNSASLVTADTMALQ